VAPPYAESRVLGRGLTNGEIVDHLFLSLRTVAFHLYRCYPKLGIAGRHQLRDLIDHAGTAQASS
jgi:DNA-binding CsgD family transcriptional regulator